MAIIPFSEIKKIALASFREGSNNPQNASDCLEDAIFNAYKNDKQFIKVNKQQTQFKKILNEVVKER